MRLCVTMGLVSVETKTIFACGVLFDIKYFKLIIKFNVKIEIKACSESRRKTQLDLLVLSFQRRRIRNLRKILRIHLEGNFVWMFLGLPSEILNTLKKQKTE